MAALHSRSAASSDPISAAQVPMLLSPSSSAHSPPPKLPRHHARPPHQLQHITSPDDSLTKELTRGTPTDGCPLSKSSSQQDVAQKRSQYFNEVFTSREPFHTPRHRVNQDSIVVVELKTNVLVQNDFDLLTDLSFNLAQIFQRPETSILLYVEHNSCLMFGTSYSPAYLATISALPCSVAPITNLRHTVLIQAAIHDILGIPGNRGVLKFESMAEENFATNGATIKDEIEQLEQRSSNDEHTGSVFKSISRSMSRKIKSNTSQSHGNSAMQPRPPSVPAQAMVMAGREVPRSESPVPAAPSSSSPGKQGVKGKDRVIKKCQSIRQMFFR
ncbi:hypothetical protein FQN50_000227 [Emmonsiellopsis sp. PD_5]|nr:hypothetical protein FQN50_000227 [Emmonsiellopsis sp. PD_5]